MKAFEHLHPAIRHHIVNSLGWRSLRPLQEEAIGPILNGGSVLLIAPTAGGKTEAAIFPLLSRILGDGWEPVSVLYVCPIKALLNNLEIRLRQYAEWLGRRVGVWHGDIRQGDRNRILTDPPDILLATPESLEVMLVSRRTDHVNLFANIRAVVVDEIHAFAGDDRGWHLLAVLDRVNRLCAQEMQRVGLSATVGNPETLLEWLAAGGNTPGVVIAPGGGRSIHSDVEVDYVGNLRNAAIIISRLHRGEKRLIFCDSRAQVESLAGELRLHGVQTFVSHSSLSVDERRRAEAAFTEARNCVIVATSTLELGIDVGDLDRVIQIDAPSTVAAFLQRLGRTGRRAGTRRNCLFLATSDESFLRTLGLLELWSRDYVEPVMPPRKPYPILAQQAMALCLQETGIGRHTWHEWLRGVFHGAQLTLAEREQLVEHMLDQKYLFQDQGILSIGYEGEKQFGKRNYLPLFSVFNTPPLFSVYFGRTELGTVHQLTFQVKRDAPISLSLGGRFWRVKHIDWKRRQVFVEPGTEPGKSRWFSAGQPLSYELSQAVLNVLAGAVADVSMSIRAKDERDAILSEYEWAETGKTTIVSDEDGVSWWTFGGGVLNSAIAARLTETSGNLRYDNFAVHFRGQRRIEPIVAGIRELIDESDDLVPPISDEVREDYKFGKCVPDALLETMIGLRFSCESAWHEVRRRDLGVLCENGSTRNRVGRS
ncbi:MAG: DEAD/DEAH box helicase [Pseudomonadota bacterium]|nr:DEAD/DEAH box helicase [Pseudomonadota bacterium]